MIQIKDWHKTFIVKDNDFESGKEPIERIAISEDKRRLIWDRDIDTSDIPEDFEYNEETWELKYIWDEPVNARISIENNKIKIEKNNPITIKENDK